MLLPRFRPFVFLQLALALFFSQNIRSETIDLTFRFQGSSPEENIFLAGDFNGWSQNNESYRFTDEDGDLVFTFQISLNVGATDVQYKIVADGSWITDPLNPRRSTGSDQNSLISPSNPTIAQLSPLHGTSREWNTVIHASIGSSESARVAGTDIELLVNGNVIANPQDYFDAQTGLFAYDANDYFSTGENSYTIKVTSSVGEVSRASTFDFYPPWAVSLNPSLDIVTSLDGTTLTLTAEGKSPDDLDLTYEWFTDVGNPSALDLSLSTTATIAVDMDVTAGEYFLNCRVSDSLGQTFTARRLIVVDDAGIRVNGLDDNAEWINHISLYEIFTYAWTGIDPKPTFDYLTTQLDRIKALGANTIWLTPIFKGRGAGYWTQDYYEINPDFGTKEEFRAFVEAAHARGMRIILDLVFNHTDKQHPFFKDILENKDNSPFADYYIWSDTPGDSDYDYYYDWVNLPNLDTANPELENYLIGVAEYWMQEFDVDGYRADVAWGVEKHSSEFWKKLNQRLRNIRPEVFLLGEAAVEPTGGIEYNGLGASGYNILFDQRFTSLYDWNLRGFSDDVGLPAVLDGSIFPDDLHGILDRKYTSNKLPLRFIENHDVARVMELFDEPRSKLAHTLVFTIPGIPLILGGAETGQSTQAAGPSTNAPELEEYFAKILNARNETIRNDAWLYRIANDQSDSVYSYATVSGDKAIVCALNFSGNPKSALLDIGDLPFKMDTALTSLTDVSDVTLVADQSSLSLSLAAYEPVVFTVTLTDPPTEQPGVDPSNGSGGEANADEQIANGDFGSSGDGWNQYVESSASADFSFDNMRAEIEISQPGSAGWNIQLLYLGLSLTQSHTYTLAFTASAASARSIDAAITRNGGDYDDYGRGTFELSAEPEEFQLIVTMNQASEDDARLVFEMGNSSIGVTIDDVSFHLQDSSLMSVFNQWISGFPNLESDQIDPESDPDFDGIPNLIEFLLDFGDPIDFTKLPELTYVRELNVFRITWTVRENVDASSIRLQIVEDLAGVQWHDANQQQHVSVVTEDQTTTVTIPANLMSFFTRLKASSVD